MRNAAKSILHILPFEKNSTCVCFLSEDCLWAPGEQTRWAIRPKQTLVTAGNVAMRREKKKDWKSEYSEAGDGWMGCVWWWWWWWCGGVSNRHTSSRGLSQSSHFNLCPGGWRNQCTLILQSSTCLRREKHFLSEIRLPHHDKVQQTHTQTCIHTYTKSLKCNDCNPRGGWSASSTSQIYRPDIRY